MEDVRLISERFRELRGKSKLTQQQVADYLKVDQGYISKFERGERQLSVNLLEKAALLFGCDPACLLGKDSKSPFFAIAFRAQSMTVADLEGVAAVNRLALNMRLMKRLLEDL